MPRVAVCILNYRTKDLTIACLASVLAERAQVPDLEVIVVDNASGDGSADAIEHWLAAHPDAPVRLIRSPVNSGFSAGHNLAIAASAAPWLLLLNSDAELHPGCLATLLAVAEASPGAGLLAPRLLTQTGEAQTNGFRFARPLSEVIRGAMTGPVTRLLRRWDVPLGPAPDPAGIEWVSFACVLVRRAMIDAIGPMDEGYFLYFEDVEYCQRAARAGWGIALVPGAAALHHLGASTHITAADAGTRRRPAYYYAARSRYFAQHYGVAGLWGANLYWLLGRALAHARRLAGRSVPPATEHEARDIWINATDPFGPRQAPPDAPSDPWRDPTPASPVSRPDTRDGSSDPGGIGLGGLAAVVIGRNEGARLAGCLDSLAGQVDQVVYVDSGSSDGSVAVAQSRGARVVELDPARPFTAAWARNAGVAALCHGGRPGLVQFIDGDCTLQPGWIAAARETLVADPRCAVVCGRRREAHPQASLYNRLMDAEWDTPVGPSRACGGDALVRLQAFDEVGGFNARIIAGEEPDMCIRLRKAGWRIARIDAEMTLHDADLTRFGQWWARARRAGYAFALGSRLHGSAPERHYVRELRRALLWGAALPVLAVGGLALTPWAPAVLLLWPAQVARLAIRSRDPAWALVTVAVKPAEALGALAFLRDRLLGRTARIIEYK